MNAVHASVDHGTLLIKIEGSFNFGLRKEFTDAYEKNSNVQRIIVDMTATQQIDSTGTGMLCTLREYFGGKKSDLSIKVGQNKKILKSLTIANLNQIFEIM